VHKKIKFGKTMYKSLVLHLYFALSSIFNVYLTSIVDQTKSDIQCSDRINEEYNACSNPCHEKFNSPICPDTCYSGCFCKKGFKRNDAGVCIPECSTTVCPENEEYSTNYNRCSESCQAAIMLCTDEPQVGCTCKEGYKRDEYLHICVPENQCAPIGTETECSCTEEYKCGSGCHEQCPGEVLRLCLPGCKYGCYCKDNYFKHLVTGQCIPSKECPTCTGENEHYLGCGPNCDNSCDLYKNRTICTIRHIRCPDGCFCQPGFARSGDANNHCIQENQCN